MGLFILQESSSPKDLIYAAIQNIELHLKMTKEPSYLLESFAITQLKMALQELNKND